jgi:hypothetical protein
MTRMKNSWRRAHRPCMTALALAALTGAATISAQAQITGAQQSAIKASCRSDFMSKCSGVTPGGKDALVCLQKNVASLSTACKTAVTATLPPPAPVAAAKPVEAAGPATGSRICRTRACTDGTAEGRRHEAGETDKADGENCRRGAGSTNRRAAKRDALRLPL